MTLTCKVCPRLKVFPCENFLLSIRPVLRSKTVHTVYILLTPLL